MVKGPRVQSREFSAIQAAGSCAPVAALKAEAEKIPLVVAKRGAQMQRTTLCGTILFRFWLLAGRVYI
jgi:hypothetical protein